MPFDARVLQVLIASPGDVAAERDLMAQVIHEWNAVYARERNVVLMPLRWETDTYPVYGTPPQTAIDEQIVTHADLAVGIFWTRLGTRTEVAESGTVEEIDRIGEENKPVLLYFSRVPVDPEALDLKQYGRLSAFKKRVYPRGLVESYTSLEEFKDKVSRQLAAAVRDVIEQTTQTPTASASSAPKLDLLVTRHTIEDVIPANADIIVSRVICSDEDKIPDYEPDSITVNKIAGITIGQTLGTELDRAYYRKLVRWYQQSAAAARFRLALKNTGDVAVRDLHLDLSLTTEVDGTALFTGDLKVPTSSSSSAYMIDWGASYQGTEPVPGRSWRIEQDVPVVQVDRTVSWGPRFGWIASDDAVLHLQITVYSSSAPPFGLSARVSVTAEEQVMTYAEILEAAGATPKAGRG